MAHKLVRVLPALALCPLLGAMIGRHYASCAIGSAGAESWGWAAGVAIGLVFAILLIPLALSPPGTKRPVVGNLVLLGLCAAALADLVSQLSRVDLPWLFHAIAAIYGVGFVATLRRSARG